MQRFTLISVAVVVLAACQDATRPGEDTPIAALHLSGVLDITLTDLGTLGGRSQAFVINEFGQVAGNSTTSSGETHAFFWDGTMIDIGTFGGPLSFARAINDDGQVVGTSMRTSNVFRAFLWKNGTTTDLGTLTGTDVKSDASGINNLGQVVGLGTSAKTDIVRAGETHAFLWTLQDGMIDLGTLGNGIFSEAAHINELGQITGNSTFSFPENLNVRHSFIWENGTMTDLGTLGGPDAGVVFRRGINELGQIGGFSTTSSGETHAFFWDGTMIDIGTLGGPFSQGRGINNLGHVVGPSRTAPTAQSPFGETHAFLWTPEDGIIDLGTLGGTFSEAVAVNDHGQVVGSSLNAGGVERAFLWEDGIMTDLGSLFLHSNASDINELGQVVGNSSDDAGVEQHATLWTVTPAVRIEVKIDIKPGSDPNSINCNNEKGSIAVAILTTDDFDATTVDHATVTFEGARETHVNKKTGLARRHEEDVDGDGDTDLVFHFRLGDTDLTCDSTEGMLTGQTFNGTAIEGTDAVRMVD